jgi:hypothetical protein
MAADFVQSAIYWGYVCVCVCYQNVFILNWINTLHTTYYPLLTTYHTTHYPLHLTLPRLVVESFGVSLVYLTCVNINFNLGLR